MRGLVDSAKESPDDDVTAADVEARQGELADAEHDVEKDQENIAEIQDNVTEAKDALAEIKPRSLPGPY